MSHAATIGTNQRVTGAVDLIAPERVYGWFMWKAEPSRRAWITVTADGVSVRAAIADLFRADLHDAGIGDGCYGFEFILGSGEIRAGASVCVFAAEDPSAELILLDERDAAAAPDPRAAPIVPSFADLARAVLPITSAPAATTTVLHMDVSDLLMYLFHHRQVTGIQRVQCGFIANMLRLHDATLPIQFCMQTQRTPIYHVVPRADLLHLMQEMRAPRIAAFEEWRAYVTRLLAIGTKAEAAFQPGDILLMIGAPWIYPDYQAAIARAKAAHGVRYFQVVYDLIPTFVPEHCDAPLVANFNAALAGMLRHADHLFPISRFTAGDIARLAERCGIAAPPMTVIEMGATLHAAEEVGERDRILARGPDRTLDRFFRAHRLDEYVLCVCTIESRKNHSYLYQIWKRLIEMHGARTPKLVLVGRLGWHIEPLQRALKMSNGLEGRIVQLGDVTDRELHELYRRCLFTVFPSLYEGWGLPVAEALYFGKVPVASGVTAMPEVGGEWAVYIDPCNIEDGFRKIDVLLTDRALLRRSENRIAGHYQPLTWQDAASAFHQLLLDLAAGLGPDEAEEAEVAPASRPLSRPSVPTLLPLPGFHAIGDIANRPASARPEDVTRHYLRAFVLREMLDGPDWHAAEPWGCWTRGTVLRLILHVDPAGFRPALCFLSVVLAAWSPATRCAATINGDPAGHFLLPGSGSAGCVRLPIMPAHVAEGAVRIEVTLERITPNPEPDESDDRVIGLGLRNLFLCRQDDFEARLAYLEDRDRA